MPSKHLKIENLDDFQELTLEDACIIQGGITVEEVESPAPQVEERIAYPLPTPVPIPCYPLPFPRHPRGRKRQPKRDSHSPCICSPYPTKGGKLPWCAVIL